MKEQVVVVFDSGIGGLEVAKKACELRCNVLFVMDNYYCPYGNKTCKQIKQRIEKIIEEIKIKYEIVALVLACNTATSVAIDYLRKNNTFPIIGMEPPIKPAIIDKNENILVLSTPITNKYNKLVKSYANYKGVSIVSFSTLAKNIEQKFFELDKLKDELILTFDKTQIRNTDCIVLGCSHFQYLEKIFKSIFEKDIKFYHSEQGVIKRLNSILMSINYDKVKNPKIAIIQTKYDDYLLQICESVLLHN